MALSHKLKLNRLTSFFYLLEVPLDRDLQYNILAKLRLVQAFCEKLYLNVLLYGVVE